MIKYIIFGASSIPVIIVSWRALFSFQSHGLFRFFSWECILWLFASNYSFWFHDPFSINQIISWALLIIAGYVVIAGVILLKRKGKSNGRRSEKNLYKFEETTELVTSGIYKYIRHPLYASLLFLTWGIFFKQPGWLLLAVSICSTGFLIITAILDEKECLSYFGEPYRIYMKKSKRFIPFVF